MLLQGHRHFARGYLRSGRQEHDDPALVRVTHKDASEGGGAGVYRPHPEGSRGKEHPAAQRVKQEIKKVGLLRSQVYVQKPSP